MPPNGIPSTRTARSCTVDAAMRRSTRARTHAASPRRSGGTKSARPSTSLSGPGSASSSPPTTTRMPESTPSVGGSPPESDSRSRKSTRSPSERVKSTPATTPRSA